MINNLKEINRVLLAIKQRESEENSAKKHDVIEECKNIVIGGHIPDHNETLSFCITSNILEEHTGSIRFSKIGEQLFQLNKEKQYELTHEQKEILIKRCFFGDYFKEKTLQILKQFYVDYKRQTFIYSLKNEIPIVAEPVFLSLLKQAELILEDENLLIINNEFTSLVSALRTPTHQITDDELTETLKIQKIVGKIAEKIVFEYEKKRLFDEGAKAESNIVQNISNTFVNAGYDINSFDNKTKDLKFNRFIEVKGSTGTKISFFISNNEMNKAKDLGKKYWIYFVPEIDIMTGLHSGEIIKMQNPTNDVFNNSIYAKECVKTWIYQSNEKC